MIKALLGTCRGYLRLLLFMAAVLAGVQIPAFISAYEHTVRAHLSEVTGNLEPFEQDAKVHTQGSLLKLVERYKANHDAAIRDGGVSLDNLVKRRAYLHRLNEQLSASPWSRIWYGLFETDAALFAETQHQYDYQIMLDVQAIGWGLLSGLLMMVLFDLLYALCGFPFRRQGSERTGSTR